MLKCSTSLWSADLANLASEVRRVNPYSDLYHIDVADGIYAKRLLFFPDLVAAIRPHSEQMFEVHLITLEPGRWVEPFAQAGANRIVFYPDACLQPRALVQQIKTQGLSVGISLGIDQPPSMIDSYLDQLDVVCVVGTPFDIKGVHDLADGTCEKITELVAIRRTRGLSFQIESDGAIRRHTVPRLRQAGTDIIVAGSLMFKEDPKAMRQWLASLEE